ncbi:DUF4907 domain-containing protein [Chitinophaga japonensis]|nr:DUF4907 domain-containing protein [Chitinophaga japonensis]
MIKGKHKIAVLLTGSVLLLVFIAFTTGRLSRQPAKATAMQDSIAVVPFQTAGGWGYAVNVGAHTYIYQDIIPAVPGKSAFRTREDALRVGMLVAEKLRNQQVPTISREELAAMSVIDGQ